MKIKILHKLKAGGLQLVVFVTVVVALLLSSFVLYMHLNSMYKVDNENILNAIHLSDSGFDWIKTHAINYQDTLNLSISETEKLKISKTHWGIFDLVCVSGISHNKTFTKMAFAGGQTPVNDNFALLLKDKTNPLVLVGNTNLRGDLYTSRYGIKAGNISGIYYENNELYQGNMRENDFELSISSEKANYMKSIDDSYNLRRNDLDFKYIDTLSQSFNEATAYIYSDEKIYLEDKFIYGNIIIQSGTSIEVGQSSKLEDIILIAPSITIKEGFKGTVQCFSNAQINVESNVNLQYPSALIMNPKQRQNREGVPKITVNANVILHGSIVYFKYQEQTKRYEPNITIESNTSIFGMIYSEQNLELYGKVSGSVVTERFITKYDFSTYINHLFNASISSDFISEHQVGLVFDSNNLGISKWVY